MFSQVILSLAALQEALDDDVKAALRTQSKRCALDSIARWCTPFIQVCIFITMPTATAVLCFLCHLGETYIQDGNDREHRIDSGARQSPLEINLHAACR